MLSNGTSLNDLDIIQRQITQKRYKIELHLQRRTDRKSCMVYRTAPFSMILGDP